MILRASAFVSYLEGVCARWDGRTLDYEKRVDHGHSGCLWHDLFKHDRVKEAVLSDRASGDALEPMRRIIDLVLRESGQSSSLPLTASERHADINIDSVSNLKEHRVLISPKHHIVTTFYRDVQHPVYTESSAVRPRRTTGIECADTGERLEHRLLSVCLRQNGKRFAIDVCGAQFGLSDCVY